MRRRSRLRCCTQLVVFACTLASVSACGDHLRVPITSQTILDSLSIAGTYSLRVCRGACSDTNNVLRRGALVLNPIALDWSTTPDSLANLLSPRHHLRGNLCYAMDSGTFRGNTYAGLSGVASTEWRFDDTRRRIIVNLYQSPDASYSGALVLGGSPDTLLGRGRSAGFGALIGAPIDELVAIRIGPPSTTPCEEGARVLSRALRRRFDSLSATTRGPGAARTPS